MNPPNQLINPISPLESLLSRNDIWRGDSYCASPQMTLDTGYTAINSALLNSGWPRASLIEVCQKELQHQEWLLFLPRLKMIDGCIFLLNPPGEPFGQALIQAGIDLERIIVVHVANKADFLASFTELARTQACDVLFAWQQQHHLSYTELRKCLLASNENSGLCVLFRPGKAWQQSSPATLRLQSQVTATHLQLHIFKQKGMIQSSQTVHLPLPETFKSRAAYSLLDQIPDTEIHKKSARILPLRRGKK